MKDTYIHTYNVWWMLKLLISNIPNDLKSKQSHFTSWPGPRKFASRREELLLYKANYIGTSEWELGLGLGLGLGVVGCEISFSFSSSCIALFVCSSYCLKKHTKLVSLKGTYRTYPHLPYLGCQTFTKGRCAAPQPLSTVSGVVAGLNR
jgi:hypothetical protein